MDLPGQDPLDLLAEVEEVLDIQASPLNWPIGSGKDFKGVVDRRTKEVILFEKGAQGGSSQARATRHTLDEAKALIADHRLFDKLDEDLELLEEAGNPFSQELFSNLEVTPVFFGSALTNFGVEPFFDSFSELAPSPSARLSFLEDGTQHYIDPISEPFSAYVFKLQANMDPRHRDSMAFLRICSGRFQRDLTVSHSRHSKKIRLSRSHSMFGGSRTTVEDGFPGDIVGVVNPGSFAIGDTISITGGFSFQPMPRFPPEVVARIRPTDAMRRKSFEKGIDQFRNEGAVLVLEPLSGQSSDLLVAAVGPLQFEVLSFRLKTEYKVDAALDMLPYQFGAWLTGDPDSFHCPSGTVLAKDNNGNIIFLYKKDWERGHALERNPDHQLASFVA
jgi:peptide chain release factor 3